jgi:hypothetical protein
MHCFQSPWCLCFLQQLLAHNICVCTAAAAAAAARLKDAWRNNHVLVFAVATAG